MKTQVSRRTEILIAARHQIAQRGYLATSVRDIAESVGLLAGSLYSHFRSKAEIVHEIVSGFYDELIAVQRAALELDEPGSERYATMIGTVFDVCSRHQEELTILHYDWATLSTLDELSGVVAQSLQTLDIWRTVVTQGKGDGSILDSIDVEVMVRMTTSSIHGLLDTVRYSDRPLPTGQRAHLRDALVRVLMQGVESPR